MMRARGDGPCVFAQLEAIEDHVPNWMSVLPASVIKNTISTLYPSDRKVPAPPASHTPPTLVPTGAARGRGAGLRGRGEAIVGTHDAGTARGGGGGSGVPLRRDTEAELGPTQALRRVPTRRWADREDPKMEAMDVQLRQALRRARALRRAAAKKQEEASLGKSTTHTPAVNAVAAPTREAEVGGRGGLEHEKRSADTGKGVRGGMSEREVATLGGLFSVNTILSRVGKARRRAYDIAVSLPVRVVCLWAGKGVLL